MSVAISTFAGMGGGALAAARSGYQVKSFDFDKDAHATLTANGCIAVCADVADVNWAPYSGADLLVGGPPCQSFSAAGLQTGESDPRNAIPAFLRAVRDVRPRVFIMENVRGLTFAKNRPYLDSVLASLRALGYTVDWRVLNAADFGVPQTRQRVFVVGRLDGPVVWPLPTHADGGGPGLRPWVSLLEALPGLSPDAVIVSNYGTGGDPKARGIRTATQPAATVTTKSDRNVWRLRPATTVVGSFGADVIAGPGYRTAGGPSRQNAPGSVKVSQADRKILQGFPPSWKIKGSKTSIDRQLGNACPPALLQAVITAQVEINEVPADTFKRAIDRAFDSERVRDMLTPYTVEDLAERRCFLSPDLLTGFVIDKAGDFGNLFNVGPKGRGVGAVAAAVRHGARTLDCFDPWLPVWYERQGWKVERREDNWTPGGPAVAYMRYEG
jgi:DNA (cytosine-5)-methyltransferase 1